MSNPPFEQLFFSRTRDFLDVYLSKQAGRSMHTRKAYKSTLTQFYDYVADVRKISPLHFRFADCKFRNYLCQKFIGLSLIRRISLFIWMHRHELVSVTGTA